jgi:hypothetical protein
MLYLHSLTLRGVGQTSDALDYLRRAYDQVTSAAERIHNPEYRSSWLDRAWINREIISAWDARQDLHHDDN